MSLPLRRKRKEKNYAGSTLSSQTACAGRRRNWYFICTETPVPIRKFTPK